MRLNFNLLRKLRCDTNASMRDCYVALLKAKNQYLDALNILQNKSVKYTESINNNTKLQHTINSKFSVIAVKVFNNRGILLKFVSQSDFIFKSIIFQNMVHNILNICCDTGIVNLKSLYTNNDVSNCLYKCISQLNEKILISHIYVINSNTNRNIMMYYIHNKITDNIGGICVILVLHVKSKIILNNYFNLGKKIAMHIAAMDPKFINIVDFNIFLKNQHRFDKSIVYNVNDAKKCVLLEQRCIFNTNINVKQFINESQNNVESEVFILKYKRFESSYRM